VVGDTYFYKELDMSLMVLSLENLKELDFGKVAVMFNSALERAVRDCVDRPGDKKVRKVTFQLDLKPIVDQDAELECVEVKCQAKTSVPNFQNRGLQLVPRKDRGQNVLAFNPDSADARQNDLGFTDAD